MVAGIMEIVAETMVFAEKTGLGTKIVQKLIEANFGPLAFSDSQRMTEGVYMPGQGSTPYAGRQDHRLICDVQEHRLGPISTSR